MPIGAGKLWMAGKLESILLGLRAKVVAPGCQLNSGVSLVCKLLRARWKINLHLAMRERKLASSPALRLFALGQLFTDVSSAAAT
jgi:hypothetical protein